jgi:hypothetical protein
MQVPFHSYTALKKPSGIQSHSWPGFGLTLKRRLGHKKTIRWQENSVLEFSHINIYVKKSSSPIMEL